MNPAFAATFYFIALLNRKDLAHTPARQFWEASPRSIVTTPWILTELADAFSNSSNRRIAIRMLRVLRASPSIQIVPATTTLFDAGLELYASRPDKDWSLTDCISFVVMTEQGLADALTGDHHFEQAGFAALLKK